MRTNDRVDVLIVQPHTTQSARCTASVRKKIAECAVLFGALLGAHNTVAAHGNECSAGVYIGTVGHIPFSLRLGPNEPNPSEPRMGSLYYRTGWTDLSLKREPGHTHWSELGEKNRLTGRLTLQCQDKQLTGEWVSVDGAKRLPVAAIANPEEHYDTRRVQTLKPSKLKPSAAGGLGFETFAIAGPKMQGSDEAVVTGVRLLGTDSGITKVNRLLWAETLEHIASALDCSADFRSRFGEQAPALSFEQNVTDILWPFVIVDSKMGVECGWGLRVGVEKRVYQLLEGRRVETAEWFLPELRKARDDEWRASPLGKTIARLGESQRHQDDAECLAAAGHSVAQVYPSRQGLVFQGSLPTPLQHCGAAADVTVPYPLLSRYLSVDGKRAVKAIAKTVGQSPTP